MRVGGDPAELEVASGRGWGHAFALMHGAGRVARAAVRVRGQLAERSLDDARATSALGWRVADLDVWVRHVAAALRGADASHAGQLRLRLLTFGPTANPTMALRPRAMTTAQLADAATWPELLARERDLVVRALAARHLPALDTAAAHAAAAAATAPPAGPGLVGAGAGLLDRHVIDRVSPIADLHVTPAEHAARLDAQARGVRRLLEDTSLTWLSFDPGGTGRPSPTARVALGDVSNATHLAVLVPGTTSGVHNPGIALRDARALHARSAGEDLAVIVDLYDAPKDLGRAADPATGRAAGTRLARFLGALPARPVGTGVPRLTLVGHSYGAFTAAHAATAAAADRTHLDALVLLGAPGVGAAHVEDLALPATTDVWAARAPGDPVALAADLDEIVQQLPPTWQRGLGPLADPMAALGPDPMDATFGARRLPTATSLDGGTAVRGHVDYLATGSASLANVRRVVRGQPVTAPARPRPRDGSAGAGREPRRTGQRQEQP